jgi:hypothetical protein
MSKWFSTLLIIAFCVGFMAKVFMEWKACDDAGGIFVRGIFWFECIGAR